MHTQSSGLRAWIWQRVSTVVLALFIGMAIVYIQLKGFPRDVIAWRHLVAWPPLSISFCLFFGALLAHAWVGVRDIILDYLSRSSLRHPLLALLALWLFSLGFWMLLILTRLFSNAGVTQLGL